MALASTNRWTYYYCNHGNEIVRNKANAGSGMTHRCKGPRDANNEPQWSAVIYLVPGKAFTATAIDNTCPCADHKNTNIAGCFVPVFGNEAQLQASIDSYKYHADLRDSIAQIRIQLRDQMVMDTNEDEDLQEMTVKQERIQHDETNTLLFKELANANKYHDAQLDWNDVLSQCGIPKKKAINKYGNTHTVHPDTSNNTQSNVKQNKAKSKKHHQHKPDLYPYIVIHNLKALPSITDFNHLTNDK
eukprot:242271_1